MIFADPSLGASKSQAVFVDPYTAEVSGELVQYGSSGALPLRTWLSEFHRHLHLGEPGRLYSELAASWLWAVVLGGVLLWIGRRRARPGARGLLLLRRGAPQGRSRTVNRHAVLGVWAAVGLVLISATGLTWSTYAGARIGAVQDRLGGATPSSAPNSPRAVAPATRTTVTRAMRDMRATPVRRRTVPRRRTSAWTPPSRQRRRAEWMRR